MPDILQNDINRNKPLGMGYFYILFIFNLLFPYFLGYSAFLLLPDFKSGDPLPFFLMIFVYFDITVSALYFTLCIIKLAKIGQNSFTENLAGYEENAQIIRWKVPMVPLFRKLKILRIPEKKIKLVKVLVKIIIFQDIVYCVYLLALIIIN